MAVNSVAPPGLERDSSRFLMVGAFLLALLFLCLAYPAAKTPYFAWDVSGTAEIQAISFPGFSAAMWSLTFVGNRAPAWIITICAALIIFLLGKREEALTVAGFTLISRVSNILLKTLIGRPRPDGDIVSVLQENHSLSFPSGHVMYFVTFLGILGLLFAPAIESRLLRSLLWAIIAILWVAMGLSRIYLGAHWPSDVIGGMLAGGFMVLLTALYRRAARHSRRGR